AVRASSSPYRYRRAFTAPHRTAPASAKCGHRSTPVPVIFIFYFTSTCTCTLHTAPSCAGRGGRVGCGPWMDGWTSTCLLFFSHHQKQNLPTPVFFLFFLPLTTPPTTSNIPPRTAKEARTVSQTSSTPTLPNASSPPFIFLFYALDRLHHTTSISPHLPHHSSPAPVLRNPAPLPLIRQKALANVPALEEFGRARRKRNRSKEKKDDQHDPSTVCVCACVFMWCLVPA
ncbi:hypothetical protein LZ31DRAFT_609636, partial [Colletotrichum somersetense]